MVAGRRRDVHYNLMGYPPCISQRIRIRSGESLMITRLGQKGVYAVIWGVAAAALSLSLPFLINIEVRT